MKRRVLFIGTHPSPKNILEYNIIFICVEYSRTLYTIPTHPLYSRKSKRLIFSLHIDTILEYFRYT